MYNVVYCVDNKLILCAYKEGIMREWMTIDDLSVYLQIPQTKIRFLIKQNKIPFHDKFGSPRFFKPEIDDWMRTPMSIDLPKNKQAESFIYRDKPIKEYVLTATKILSVETAWSRLPGFIKDTVNKCQEIDRSFLYRKEFEPLINNFNDYLRVSCWIGLIDNRPGLKREKHYYPTEFSEKVYHSENIENIKIIMLDSILHIVKHNMETTPQERHAIFLLWYLLKIKGKRLKPDESHFNKGGEDNSFPIIRLNFTISLCDFLFEKDRSKEEEFLESWEKYLI